MPAKISVVQMYLKRGTDKKESLKHALDLMDQAADDGSQAVCFPDYFLTDCPTVDDTEASIRKIAEPIPGPVTEAFGEKARKYGMYVIAGSIVELGEDNKLYSTAPIIGPDGKLVGKVRKSHPENAPAKYELACGITPGNGEYEVFETKIGKVGVMLDMDGTAVEVPRILGLKGAEIIFWPINFSVRFLRNIHLDILYNSTASHAYVAASSRIGWRMNTKVHGWAFMGETQVDMMYGGPSAISFGGSYVAAIGDFSEGVVTAKVYPERVAAGWKSTFSVMPLARRPDTYQQLCDIKNMPWFDEWIEK